MAKQSPKVYARASIAVVAILTIAWGWPAFGDEPERLMNKLSKSSPYTVFLSQNPRREQQEAIIAVVVQASNDPNAGPALVFLQTMGNGHIGKGMVCEDAKEREDSALECHRTVGSTTETLRVAAIGSKFCTDVRDQIEACVKKDQTKKGFLYTSGGDNPIIDPNKCKNSQHPERECVCYEISHNGSPVCTPGHGLPPNSGTGTGGHN
jgi:hypothetical protein